MYRKLPIMIAALTAITVLSNCAAAIGAGAVVGADKIAENEQGGDGLF